MSINGVIRELEEVEKQISEKDAQIVALEKKLQVYTDKRFSAPSTICRTYHVQMCHCCDRFDCGDNESPAARRIFELENQLRSSQRQIEQLAKETPAVKAIDSFLDPQELAKYAGEVDGN